MPSSFTMEDPYDSDNNSNCSSLMTLSTDSDSVLSVILNHTQTQDNVPKTFTYGAPLPVGSCALASRVYVLIDKGRSMSADMRVMWYLKRLGTMQMVDDNLDVESPEQCKIMSFIPREKNLDKDGFANSIFVMDAFTRVYFLTAVYNMVYCLDMSPSNCSVDIQRCHVMLDEMTVALRRSIKGFIRPFIVPGSEKIVFEPQVYVTVIVHTPFYTSPAQQVLVQGWLINNHNFQEFIRTITTEMNRLENSLAMTKKTIRKPLHPIDEIETYNTSESESDDSSSDDHDPNSINSNSNVMPTFNNNPDSGFINTLRYGMLAVRLLPQSSISNLIVITDGMITLADIQVLDSVLNQLRCISVACSFLHVSSQFHPHSGHGNVPYSELMQLIATATSGTYLNSFPKTTHNLVVNYYHDKFIMWSFKRGDGIESPNNTTNLSCTPPRVRPGEWTVRNSNFYGNRQSQLVTKKQFSDHIQANLDNIVCCRLREGFIIEDIQYKDAGNSTVVPNMNNSSKLQLKLILPWTNHIYIEYDITVKWPPSVKKKVEPIIIEETPELVEPLSPTTQPPASIQLDSLNIYYTVSVKGPYEFLHDITCTGTKKSQLLSKIPRQCQFQLSSCRSSSISVATPTTTITRNLNLLPETYSSIESRVTSKYRQALIARFWLTMRSIAQTDLLIKHLEAYSPSTGHLNKPDNCNQPLEQNKDQQPRKQENQKIIGSNLELSSQVLQNLQILETPQILQLDDSSVNSSNLNSTNSKTDTVFSTEKTESNLLSFLASEIPNKSPLHSGVPLFYYSASNSNISFNLKQSQSKTDDQQQNNTDQHQRFADFWKPVCTLDPDTQWPKWFSTYRIGGGVLLLRHDRPLPQWFRKENKDNDSYQTLTCTKSSVSLFALLKQWCTFVLIDEHSYVKCLDQSETYTDDVSFCIARVSPRPPSCCCVVLHLAFQSCVPASVHHKIIDGLKNNIELLDSTTVMKLTSEDNNQGTEDQENREGKTSTIIIAESLKSKKPIRHQKYVYLMDKPLEKILIRYERIPSEFTTVIFPDGSQPSSAITTINTQNPRSKLNIELPLNTVRESTTGVESKAVSTTTTLSRYLYHKRWIWNSECSHYSQCSNSVSQKLQLQFELERILSVLTRIRLREGFKFAHSSAGIINMVLEVDMIEGSLHCSSTPTSHCVIQYVLFPPNKLQKQQQKTYECNSVFDQLNMENNDVEKSSILTINEQQKFEKRQNQGKHIVSFANDSDDCCLKHRTEDEYQLITECWIEPQHGTVIVNKKQNYNYMSGLMYEQLADALWQVDSDCIGSLFTFQHMQHMCMNQNILVSNPDIDLNKKRRQSKTVIIDAGRIYKLPFTFNLVNLLPKCRHYSSLTFSLFTADHNDTELSSARDERKLNYILESSFYSRLRTYNNRSFNVKDSDMSVDMNQTVNDQEIGQCFIKHVDDTRLILTVGPSLIEEKFNISDNLSEDNLPPFGRSRANTWHYTKRGIGQSLLSTQSHENSIPYYRTMSLGSKPYYKDSEDMSWAQLRLEQNLSTADIKQSSCLSNINTNEQDYPTHMFIDIYDCRQEDVENVLMSDSSFDHSLTDDYSEERSSCNSTETDSDEYEEEKNTITTRDQIIYDDPPIDPMFLEKYLYKIRVIYDRSLVSTVFQALHLGLNVRYMDIQRAVDRCQHRLISFDITDYIKVVCDHFKKNADTCSICPSDNTTLKSHHDMIHSKFSATLDRHMLKPVANHQDYYFYDLIDDLDCDEHSNNSRRQKYITSTLLGETYHKIDFDTYELDEEDIFPLFVHLVCTIKTDTITKSQSVRSLPTCILELLIQDNDKETSKNIDFSNLKVSLDVYCLMLPINAYDDDDDDDDEIDRYTTMNSSEQLHFPINNKSTTLQSSKQTYDYENSFAYLSSSLPPQHAQGLAEFLAEVEWCMRDEMAAGLLQYPTVTINSLKKIIEHISNSPKSPSNNHQQIPVHFVVPLSRPSKNNSVSLFLQKLEQLDIILDTENGNERYALEQSTKDTFYVVKKNLHPSPDSTVFESYCDDLENSPGSDGFLTDIDHTKSVLPNFWIILKIQPDLQCQKEQKSDNNNTVNTLLVNVYFHCRFSELNAQGKYPAIMEIVKQNVYQAATIVNQTNLLCCLYETKTCDSLLEPIIEDHDHSDDADENGIGEGKKINYFTLGQFKCPVVWSTRFSLHPRLQRATAMGLLGIHILHTMLEGFSVRNRRNMFVYKESSGSVFYLRIYENSSQQQQEQKNNNVMYSLQYDSDDDDTMSRCSSATSTTITSTIFSNQSNFSRKYSEDINYMDNKSIQNPGTRSLGGYWGDVDSKDVEDLTLKVHGISPVGDEIRIDLVRVLQNRLNDGVLELLTTMLYRNPMCRLYPDDVRFIQPSNGHPDYTMKLSLPDETKITKLFIHNLKRNAATLLLFPPQYASRYHRFNYAYSMINETKNPINRSFFMYNQPIAGTSVIGGKRITSGKRGLACVLFDIYSNEDHGLIDYLFDYPIDPEFFERRIEAKCIDDLKSTAEFSGYIKLFVWWRGRDNMEVLQQKLTSTVIYSLWDIYIERFLWEQPLIIEQPSEIYVNPLCIQFLAKWLAFGARKSVPLAYHSKNFCRIHMNHVLREFKTHLSWSWLSSSNNLPIYVRYFYVPRSKYGETSFDCVSNNIISGSTDPLQLRKKHDSTLNNLMFYEWQVPDTDSIVCPPSAACVLIVAYVTSTKNKQKRKRHQQLNMDNEHSDSDADNSFAVAQNHENINTEEINNSIETLTTDDQPLILINNTDENITQNTLSDDKKPKKPQKINTCEKITKLFLLAVSGQSVHALSYNCHKNEDQPIAIQRLSRWLEWRSIAFTSSIHHMIGLRNSKIYGQFGNSQIHSHSSRINNNLELLLDYKNYVAVVGEHESYKKIFIEKNVRLNNRVITKPLDNDTEDKKNKPLNYTKDIQDSYIERLVRNSKQRCRTELYQKLLYDMWIQVDAVISKEAFRIFYQHSRLIHYCLTPLLFLPWWRLESAATRDHLVDASKLKTLVFSHVPQWHKRLCARLTVAYSQYIETDPLFSGFQPIQIGKSRVYNDNIMDQDSTKSITRYYKKTIPGVSGGLLLIEIGVCQPFYYIKLSCIERARITNLVENYKDKYKPFCLLEHSEYIIQNMHLHSFTYDFHVRTLSDRLSKLVEKQKAGKRCNFGCDILMSLDHKNSIQNDANKTGNNSKKNAIAGFLDDFLKYYTLPPLYSNCLVLAGVIKRSEIPVTGIQLYEYLVENCSEDCEGMAVLKIGDSSSPDGDDGGSLFDDYEDHEFLDSQHIFSNDLTDYILVHQMAGRDIQRRQELANNSNNRKSGMESNEYFTDNQYEVCGLFDATLIMTLSSVKQLLLDTSNEITLSYYVLLTNNENYNLKNKKAISLKTVYNMQQRHSTPIRPSDHRFDQSNNILSASVPSNSVDNSITSGSAVCGGSLDENNAFQNWSQLPPNNLPYLKKKSKKKNEFIYDDLNEHHIQTIRKRNLIKFYEKKAAELVAHTVDTAANRCRIHLLWKLFGVPIDQQKLGITDITFNQLEELVKTSVIIKSLSEYDPNYDHILKLLMKQPQWFTSLHKMISGQSTLLLETTSTLPPQCRIYNSNRSEHQYIVVLPNLTEFDEFDAFVIIDNGIDSSEKIVATSDSLVNVVFRRNVSSSEEVAALVETVGDSICYLIWQTIK